MPDAKLPIAESGRDDKQTLTNLLDTMAKYRKELEYLLMHLDSKNVLEAASVIADWIYAGNIKADQIDVTQGKITTAQIENLIVGTNVTMGAGATISWGQVSNKPVDLVYQAALAAYVTDGELSTELMDYLTTGNFHTLIGEDYIVTGKIAANQIAAGRIDAAYLATDISQVDQYLSLGSGTGSPSSITFNGVASIEADNTWLTLDAQEAIIMNTTTNFLSGAYFSGYVDFSGATVDGLDTGGNYVEAMSGQDLRMQLFEGSGTNYIEVWRGSTYKGSIDLY